MITTTLARIKQNLDAARIPLSTLAKVGGISPSSLSGAFRELQYLGAEREAKLLTISVAVLEFQDALRPLLLPSDWQDLQTLLNSNVEPEKVRNMVSTIFRREGE